MKINKIIPEKFYHVSMDINLEEREFMPRIPKHRCEGENDTLKRVCVCSSLTDAIGAFPYKDIFVNENIFFNRYGYLSCYEILNENLEYKDYEDLKDLVPDAYITKEHWILNKFSSKPNIIRVNKIKLSGYNAYTNTYHGYVKELEYENSIENYDRNCDFIFIGKFVKYAINVCKVLGLNYEIKEDYYYNLSYNKFKFGKAGYNGTTKKYRYTKMKIIIPKGIDISNLWNVDYKQQVFLKKKNMNINPFKVNDEDKSILKEMMDAGYYF